MKEASGAGRWKIRPGLMFEPSLEAGTSWQAEGVKEMEE